jgi:hypothetical protein
MNQPTSKKDIADFEKKYQDYSRQAQLKRSLDSVRRFPKPKLALLVEAVKGKKKPDSEEEPICEVIKYLHDLVEDAEKVGDKHPEIHTSIEKYIDVVKKPIVVPADLVNSLAGGLVLGLVAMKACKQFGKSGS